MQEGSPRAGECPKEAGLSMAQPCLRAGARTSFRLTGLPSSEFGFWALMFRGQARASGTRRDPGRRHTSAKPLRQPPTTLLP